LFADSLETYDTPDELEANDEPTITAASFEEIAFGVSASSSLQATNTVSTDKNNKILFFID